MLLSEIPGLDRALGRVKRAEQNLRDTPFLPIDEEICGISVPQLTLRRFLILAGARSAFVCGGHKTAVEIARFLWIVSHNYRPDKIGLKEFVAEVCAPLPYAKARRAIERFLQRAMVDRPPVASSSRSNNLSLAAVVIHRIAHIYGWDDEKILDRPLARLFQYLRAYIAEVNPKAPQFSKQADKITQRFVQRHLAKKKAAEEAAEAEMEKSP